LDTTPFANPVVQSFWSAALGTVAIGGGTSLVMRYRRAPAEQRQQIKLLLFVFLVWALAYPIGAIGSDGNALLGILFALATLAIPIGIAFAILRKGLFDIDLIVRRTLLYALLTGVLTAIYLGAIFLTQKLFGLEERASWQVAASTLLVTALFSPLRRRLQALIDRRLFRSRYDARLVVERFAGSAQNQSDLARLSADLVGVVQQTVSPAVARLWIKP
jgi:hypothetical protein